MSRPRFEDLQERLLTKGVAPRHVRRYLAEMQDHYDDLLDAELAKGAARTDAETRARAQLGSNEALAAAMLNRPELRSYASRFPWLVFGLGPILALAIVLVTATLVEGGLLILHKNLFFPPDVRPVAPDWLQFVVAAWNGTMTYALPIAIATGICILGLRQRISARWIMLALAVTCFVGAFHEIGMHWGNGIGPDELSAGFALAPPFPPNGLFAGVWRFAMNVAFAATIYFWSVHSLGPVHSSA